MTKENQPKAEWAPLYDKLSAYIDGLQITRDDSRRRGKLIQVLHHAQHLFGYLPSEVQEYVAQRLFLQVAEVSGVVTFYNYFSTTPKGRYSINVCLGTACYVKGSERILQEFERQLGIKSGSGMTEDGLFSIYALRCVGACGLAPVVMVNDKVYGRVKPEDVKTIIAEYRDQVQEGA